MDNLDDFLKGPEVEVEAPETEAAEPEAVVEQETAPVRDEKGRFKPKGETEPEPSTSPVPAETEYEGKATIAERRRRQEAEARAAELEAQIQRLTQAQQAPPPSLWEDEQGWQQHFGGQVAQTAVQQAVQMSRLDTSEMLARQAYPDFQEMYDAFNDLARENPAIAHQALQDPHPWNKAYQIAKNHRTMQELGATDIGTLRAQLRAEIEAELKAKAPEPAPTPEIPETLANAQSARGSTQPLKIPSLDDILRR